MSVCAIRHCHNFAYMRIVAPEPDLELQTTLCNIHWGMIGSMEPVKIRRVEILVPQPITVEVLVPSRVIYKDATRRGKYDHCNELNDFGYKCRLMKGHSVDHHSWSVSNGTSYYWPIRTQVAA